MSFRKLARFEQTVLSLQYYCSGGWGEDPGEMKHCLKSAFYMRIFWRLIVCRRGLKVACPLFAIKKKTLERTGLRNIYFFSRKGNGFKDKCKCRECCGILCKFPKDVRTHNSQTSRFADSGDPGKGLGSGGRRHRRSTASWVKAG